MTILNRFTGLLSLALSTVTCTYVFPKPITHQTAWMLRFLPAEEIVRIRWKTNWVVALHAESPRIVEHTSKTRSRAIWLIAIVPGLIMLTFLGLATTSDKNQSTSQSIRGKYPAVQPNGSMTRCSEQEIRTLLKSKARAPLESGRESTGYKISDPIDLGGEALQTITCNESSGERSFIIRWNKSGLVWSLKQISRQRDG